MPWAIRRRLVHSRAGVRGIGAKRGAASLRPAMSALPRHLAERLPGDARARLVARRAEAPDTPWAELLLAAALAAAEAGQPDDAFALAAALLHEAPADAPTHLRAALLLARLGRPAAACAAGLGAFRAGQAVPHLADLMGMLGDALWRIGAVPEALAVLRVAWRSSPRPIMRRALLTAGLPAYRRSLNEGADTALLEELATAAAGAIGDIGADDLAELARLAEDAGRDDLLRALGRAALGAGDEALARRLAGIGATQAPNQAGLLLHATGRRARAGIAFSLAHAAMPDDPAARFNAGYAALAAGDAAGAAALLAPLPAMGEAMMAAAAWPCFGELPWPFAAPPEAARQGFEAMLPAGARWPRIRLVTPCFNPGPWLEETILSVAGQGYPAVEHVVVDACSTDGTAQLLQRHRHLLHRVIIEPDSGPAEAINKGLAGADADLLGWINADDLLAPGALHMLGAAWARAPDADLVHGYPLPHRARRILGVQRPLATEALTPQALADVFGRWAEGAFFLQPEVLIARGFWERLGGRLDTSLAAVFDYELWLRAAAAAPRIASTPWPTAMYRIHAAQRTAGRAALALEQLAVRDRAAPPVDEPLPMLRARLRRALSGRARLLLLDERCAETFSTAACEEARAALSRQGVALEVRAQPPEGAPQADLVLRMLRAHDGADWVAQLRAAGFEGPILGWLIEDDRDPYANAATVRALDVVIPARASRRSAVLPAPGLVMPALAPPFGLVSGDEAKAAFAGRDGPEPRRWPEGAARLEAAIRAGPVVQVGDRDGLALALLAGHIPMLAPTEPGLRDLIPDVECEDLPILSEGDAMPKDVAAGAQRRHRYGVSLLLAPQLTELLARLRSAAEVGAARPGSQGLP